jgi:hypothetical protein
MEKAFSQIKPFPAILCCLSIKWARYLKGISEKTTGKTTGKTSQDCISSRLFLSMLIITDRTILEMSFEYWFYLLNCMDILLS